MIKDLLRRHYHGLPIFTLSGTTQVLVWGTGRFDSHGGEGWEAGGWRTHGHKECQHHQILRETETLLGPWWEPSTAPIFISAQGSWFGFHISKQMTVSCWLQPPTFMVTSYSTMYNYGGKKSKNEMWGIWSGWLRYHALMEEFSFLSLCHCAFWRKRGA